MDSASRGPRVEDHAGDHLAVRRPVEVELPAPRSSGGRSARPVSGRTARDPIGLTVALPGIRATAVPRRSAVTPERLERGSPWVQAGTRAVRGGEDIGGLETSRVRGEGEFARPRVSAGPCRVRLRLLSAKRLRRDVGDRGGPFERRPPGRIRLPAAPLPVVLRALCGGRARMTRRIHPHPTRWATKPATVAASARAR
jgi:hypothetical protein